MPMGKQRASNPIYPEPLPCDEDYVSEFSTDGILDDIPGAQLVEKIKKVWSNSQLRYRRGLRPDGKVWNPKKYVRKAITGDVDKRLRDHVLEKRSLIQRRLKQQTVKVRRRLKQQTEKVKEKMKAEKVVKFFDKTGFMLGVLGLVSTELIFLSFPQYFWIWHIIVIPLLLIHRWVTYRMSKWGYFLYDFCYFVQCTLIYNMFILPDHREMWHVHFICANGPLLAAIPTWQNSLVFHSLDRTTSLFIHLFPALLTFVVRWHSNVMCEGSTCLLPWTTTLKNVMAMYFIWQILYIIKTEILDRKRLREDKSLATSVRWLVSSRTNATTMVVTSLARKLGFLAAGAYFDPDTMKAKIFFWIAQFIYTIVTCAPALFMFDSILVHALLLSMYFIISVWNGANYYIEVFSKRYVLKFSPSVTDLTETGSKIMETTCDEQDNEVKGSVGELEQYSSPNDCHSD